MHGADGHVLHGSQGNGHLTLQEFQKLQADILTTPASDPAHELEAIKGRLSDHGKQVPTAEIRARPARDGTALSHG